MERESATVDMHDDPVRPGRFVEATEHTVRVEIGDGVDRSLRNPGPCIAICGAPGLDVEMGRMEGLRTAGFLDIRAVRLEGLGMKPSQAYRRQSTPDVLIAHFRVMAPVMIATPSVMV